MQPYTPHGDSNWASAAAASARLAMQPYTPHGDSNCSAWRSRDWYSRMQPYTPHGDSNLPGRRKVRSCACGCNLIPLTGTVT